jgi:hypothetical protein
MSIRCKLDFHAWQVVEAHRYCECNWKRLNLARTFPLEVPRGFYEAHRAIKPRSCEAYVYESCRRCEKRRNRWVEQRSPREADSWIDEGVIEAPKRRSSVARREHQPAERQAVTVGGSCNCSPASPPSYLFENY